MIRYFLELLAIIINFLGIPDTVILHYTGLIQNKVEVIDEAEKEDHIYRPIVDIENYARFPGCEDKLLTIQERKACADQELMKFIYNNLKYPETCHCSSGKVVVTITIEKDGRVSNPRVRRGVCKALDEEVIRVMKKMPRWIPTVHLSGTVIANDYIIPINICLR